MAIGDDAATIVDGDAGLLQAETVGVGATADRDQHDIGLHLLGRTAESQRSYDKAIADYTDIEQRARAADEPERLAGACRELGKLHFFRGDLDRSRRYIEETIALADRIDSPRMKSAALNNLAESLKYDLDRAGVKLQLVNPGFVKTPLTDRNDFKMPFLMPVEKAVARMIAGLQSNRFEITFPRRFTWQLKLLRVLPYPLYFAITRRRTGA